MNQIELEEYHECSFDAFCKKAIRNLAVDAKRIYWKKRKIHFVRNGNRLLMFGRFR